ncbi:irregular chiasm C-roughest protein-like [Brevipalpus obovatus]|uniref:irregular chiasm C-roughest protein-like n=1 Tax=Brevipalpus obovatus TaxID=246614 RepID=UPI003D9DE310
MMILVSFFLKSLFVLYLLIPPSTFGLNRSGVVQQSFAMVPGDRKALLGETIILPCRVLNRSGVVQWTRNEFGLGPNRELSEFPRYQMTGSDDEGEFSLQISNVDFEDDAKFECQVGPAEPGIEGIRSGFAKITVEAPPDRPRITPSDHIKTVANRTITLTCESANGRPAAELTWLNAQGNPIKSGTTFKTVQIDKTWTSTLKWTFVAGREHHGKIFTCRSENSALKQPEKAAVRIEVEYEPQVQLFLDKTEYSEGDDIRFTCKALANPMDTLIFKWYRNGTQFASDLQATLLVSQVTREMNGQEIICQVSNSIGTSSAVHRINVRYPPTLKMDAHTYITANEGETVNLHCDVDANPPPSIKWFFNSNIDHIIGNGDHLIIPVMSEDKAGKYTCLATLNGFPNVSSTIHLFLQGPPKILSPAIQYASQDGPIKVECIARSVEPMKSKVTWTYNSQVIEMVNDRDIEMRSERRPKEALILNTLLIHDVRDDSFGDYNCSVSNDHGQDFMIIKLTRQKTFLTLSMVGGIIGAIILAISVTIIVILCMKHKSNFTDHGDYIGDMKKKSSKNTSSLPASINSVIKASSGLSVGNMVVGGGTGGNVGNVGGGGSVIPLNHHQHHQHHQVMHSGQLVMDSVSSGADSDVKVEIRTASSLSEQAAHWDDLNDGTINESSSVTANQIQQVVDNIYNYSSQPLYSPSKDLSINNGYIPTCYEYGRESLPVTTTGSPHSMSTTHQAHQSPSIMNDGHYSYHHHSLRTTASQQQVCPPTQSSGVPLQLPSTTHCGVNVSVTSGNSNTIPRDLYTESSVGDISSPYGTLDPHYRVPYNSVYCTNSGGYNTTNSGGGPIIGATLQVRNNGANGNIGQASPSSVCTNPYTSSIYSTNQRYITTSNSNTQGSLATHV